MISQETKDQIEKNIWIELDKYFGHQSEQQFERNAAFQIALSLATKYAEKLEDLTELYNTMSDIAHQKQIKMLELEEQLAELKSWHDYYKERAEKGESILKSATDIHFIPGKEGDNLLAAKDRELAQLKEIAERMVKILKTSDIEDEDEELEDVLMAYAEWCKQNKD